MTTPNRQIRTEKLTASGLPGVSATRELQPAGISSNHVREASERAPPQMTDIGRKNWTHSAEVFTYGADIPRAAPSVESIKLWEEDCSHDPQFRTKGQGPRYDRPVFQLSYEDGGTSGQPTLTRATSTDTEAIKERNVVKDQVRQAFVWEDSEGAPQRSGRRMHPGDLPLGPSDSSAGTILGLMTGVGARGDVEPVRGKAKVGQPDKIVRRPGRAHVETHQSKLFL